MAKVCSTDAESTRVGRVEEFLAALQRIADGGTAIDPEVVEQLLTRRSTSTTSPVAARRPRTAALWVLLGVTVLANATASTVLDHPYVGTVTGALVLGCVAALVLRARSARTGA